MVDVKETRTDVESTLPAIRSEALPVAESDAYALTPAELGDRLKTEGEKRKLLMDYIRAHLVAGTDYGMIHRWIGPKGAKVKCPNDGQHLLDANGNPAACPKCGAKHSLWKPGAEKIAGLLHVTGTYSVDTETMTALAMTGKGVAYRASLVSLQSGAILAEGRGAAALDGDYNKAIKMAKKSAMIDATLGLAGLSSLFTQDIEDLKGQILDAYIGSTNGGATAEGPTGATDPITGSSQAAPPSAELGEFFPQCPDCGSDMKKRQNKKGGEFWGCSGYPACRKTINIEHKKESKAKIAADAFANAHPDTNAGQAAAEVPASDAKPDEGGAPVSAAAADLPITVAQKTAIKDLCGQLDWKMGVLMQECTNLQIPRDVKKLTEAQAAKLCNALLERVKARSVTSDTDMPISLDQTKQINELRQALAAKLPLVEWAAMLQKYDCDRTGDLNASQADVIIAALKELQK